MEPQTNREPALQLPQPTIEASQWQQITHGRPEVAAPRELGPAVGQGAPIAMTPLPTNAMQPVQPPQTASQPMAVPLQQPTTLTTQPTSDDELDKIWVNKAKKIVEQTHTDPYRESQALGKTKVEYLKTRYNKDIKIAEG